MHLLLPPLFSLVFVISPVNYFFFFVRCTGLCSLLLCSSFVCLRFGFLDFSVLSGRRSVGSVRERKVRALEQEKSLETTKGALASLRRYLNCPNSVFD